jgi:hypothetical protein
MRSARVWAALPGNDLGDAARHRLGFDAPTVWAVGATGRCHWGRARSLAAAPAARAFRAVAAQRSSAAAEWREGPVRAGRRAFGPPAGPRRCPAGPTAGEYGGRAMRLRLGRVRLLGGLVGAWQQAKGGDAWWAARRRAGPGRSASRPDRGSARAAGAPAGPGSMTPVRAPRRPATGAAGRAASTAGRSTATATCSTWSTAPGRWRRSSTGCGGPRGR